ncbi:MFS transporter [Streptomyces sp. NPDC048253]|uniref:MFS transporter n=1 Tax=unclassified Streptomyces TaxID=2593676 RepID=UPI0006CDC111|nr:major facilitator superfamily MFS_1 [Actinobacteria bacterium OV320]
MSTTSAVPTARDSRRWMVLAVICVAYLMLTLDVTVMNLALPSAQDALDFSDADKQWVVTAYALAYGSLLLIGGKLADLIGRRETFLIGLVGFAIASAVGGAANSFTMLVTARAAQGVFAALLAPTTLSMLATTFTDPKERGKAFGAFSAVAASGGALGLLIGGALTSGLNWRWCMYVNLFFAAFSLIVGGRLLPRQPRVKSRLDVPGVLLVSGGLFCLVYGFSNAATHSWDTPSTWGFLAAGAVMLVLFAAWQTRAPQPLLPPRVVTDRNRGGAYITSLIIGIGMFGVLLFLIYYLQTDLGYSAIKSGLALLPMMVVTGVASNVGNIRLMPKVGPRPLITSGMLVNAGAMVWLTRIGPDSGYASAILGPLMLLGLGMGLIYAAALNTGTSGVAPQDAGVASATISAGSQLGGAIGIALLNTIAASAATDYLSGHAQGKPGPELFQLAAIHGYVQVFWWCAAIFAAGAVVAAALLRSGPLPTPTFGAKPVAEPEKAMS